ncbi:MAG: serine protease, partial [Balneolaceae bacterium]|jgi:S1-C subfamily serine protease
LIFSPQDLQDFDVVAADPLSDLALLSTSLSENIESLKHPLRFAPGNNDFLQMGSFLYIMGYPKGYLMTTRGLASNSEPQSRRFFVTDAIFNPGISGGLVFASKDNFRSFQWVGMARSATARTEDVLIPRPDSDSEKYSKVARPYRDSVFVQKKTRISYGITQAIPINGIKSFISDNKRAILKSGFSYSAE